MRIQNCLVIYVSLDHGVFTSLNGNPEQIMKAAKSHKNSYLIQGSSNIYYCWDFNFIKLSNYALCSALIWYDLNIFFCSLICLVWFQYLRLLYVPENLIECVWVFLFSNLFL